jgi:hypothetical protein
MMIVKIQKSFPIRVMEWLLACIMLSLGVTFWNLRPMDWQQTLYSGLANIADPHTWAYFAFGIGVIRLAALTINGAWRPSPHFRLAGAFLGCFLWLQICYGMFSLEYRALGVAVYPWLLFADIYNVFRASHDARLSDDRARAVSHGRGVMEREPA